MPAVFRAAAGGKGKGPPGVEGIGMASLFRRFRKDKKEEPSPSDSASGPTSEPTAEPVPPASPPEPPAPPPAEPEPQPELVPESPPPPLPTAPSVTPSLGTGAPGAECFLCGTPLQDRFCPKCQMTWTE